MVGIWMNSCKNGFMDLKLKRTDCQKYGIFGEIPELGLVSLEHAYQLENGSYAPKVVPGLYTAVRYKSPRLGYEVFMLKDVPGCEWIEIHKGNNMNESSGCILLGMKRSDPMILQSKMAFAKFMSAQSGCDSFKIYIS